MFIGLFFSSGDNLMAQGRESAQTPPRAAVGATAGHATAAPHNWRAEQESRPTAQQTAGAGNGLHSVILFSNYYWIIFSYFSLLRVSFIRERYVGAWTVKQLD